MPISLNPLESQSYIPTSIFTNVMKRKLKTTKEMVENALIELHEAKGVTVNKILKFILSHYNIESLSKRRTYLIKEHLRSLRENEDIFNITGKGLTGHFKLVNKKKFIKQIEQNTTKAFVKIKSKPKANKTQQKTKKSQRIISSIQIAPVIPNKTVPVFDTPILPFQVSSSTPLISNLLIPWAPGAQKKRKKGILPDIDMGTPRSSASDKKRKSRRRIERVY